MDAGIDICSFSQMNDLFVFYSRVLITIIKGMSNEKKHGKVASALYILRHDI